MTGTGERPGTPVPTGPPPPPPVVARFPADQHRRGHVLLGVLTVVALVLAGVALAGPRTIDGRALAVPGASSSSGSGGQDGAAKPLPKEVRELETNPLLAQGVKLGSATCKLPQLGRSSAQLEAYYKAFAECLAEAWQPALDQANEPTPPATVRVRLPETSACGNAPDRDEAVAYYCGGDATIYAPTEWMLADAGLERSRHLATIAHEYGHHVQRSSGMLAAAAEKMTSAGEDSPADKELVRRIELQANCFGALALAAVAGRGSISNSLGKAALADYGRADDSDTHGSRKHQLKWARAGFNGKTTASCNTWVVPAAEVS